MHAKQHSFQYRLASYLTKFRLALLSVAYICRDLPTLFRKKINHKQYWIEMSNLSAS